ncbi:hypothetical protein N9Z92_02775 [Akkermansiaceae bacterium]|nr:hypothetical protein [Akkermansiaceae bacterium]MDB4572809.1 hypothetical protein [Akkermansiaceae bacterium]MDF1711438.1 hypothetical protein [Akkermansiaceae bacterium]
MKMNILKRLLVLGLTLLPSSLFGATQILPAPKTIEVQEGANVLGSTIRASEAYLEQANALQQALLALTGQTFKVQDSTTEKSTLQLLHNDSLNNPLSPPSDPVQRRLQSPPAKSKFLAVTR